MAWQGFSLFWYGKAFSNPLIMGALRTSVIIALSTAVLSAIIGTLTALGPRARPRAGCASPSMR